MWYGKFIQRIIIHLGWCCITPTHPTPIFQTSQIYSYPRKLNYVFLCIGEGLLGVFNEIIKNNL